jgi:glucose-1-phosphate cytidylyltransferase
LEGEPYFLANYADGLSDLHLPTMIQFFHQHQAIASFLSVRPSQSFHSVAVNETGMVTGIRTVNEANLWINGGYFVLSPEIFHYIEEGDDLVAQPFRRLIAERKLVAMKHHGFWGCMDTYKEKQCLEDMYTRGDCPWELWKHSPGTSGRTLAACRRKDARDVIPVTTSRPRSSERSSAHP